MYVEKPPKALWITAMALLTLAFLAWFVITIPNTHPNARVLIWIVLGMVAYSIGAFFLIQYRIGPDRLEISYPPFTFSIERRNIQTVHIIQAPWWMGIGVKMFGRRLAFTTRHGTIVDVEKNSGFFRHIWLSPADPEAFAKQLKK